MKGILTRAEVFAECGHDEHWNAYVDSHPNGWWFHRSEWLEYSLAMSPQAVDLSAMLVEDERIKAIQPMLRDHDGRLVCGGQYTPAMLAETDEDAAALRAHYLTKFDKWPAAVQHRPDPLAQTYFRGLKQQLRYTHVLDLSPSLDTLHAAMWNSNKNLINRALRRYELTVTTAQWANMGAVKALHERKMAAHSLKVWMKMARWVKDGRMLLAALCDGTNLLGYALAIVYKDWAYYASGQTLVDDTQCALQWALIRRLKWMGIKYYELGKVEDDDARARSVAAFKSGFGSTRWPQMLTVEAAE